MSQIKIITRFTNHRGAFHHEENVLVSYSQKRYCRDPGGMGIESIGYEKEDTCD
ncbi:MAG TPA: hypothetical protein VFI33_19410 [Puia sp.]|nr:hypothetical protein [Puia sp.]